MNTGWFGMDKTILKDIAMLRLCIGFLGESQQYGWWSSAFFSTTSTAFLLPVFSKTSFSAQYYGVKEAATVVHDEHIGIGKDVFHLFRLPEMHEIELHNLLGDSEIIKDAQRIVSHKDIAEQFLQEYAKNGDVKEVGPVRLGDTKDLANRSTWKVAVQHYLKAFTKGTKTFPYFSKV